MSNKNIAFFSVPNGDNFIDHIIDNLSKSYNTKKIIVENYDQVFETMKWADICWFEWCDDVITEASKHQLAKEKKIICRLHSWEAFGHYLTRVKWENVDHLIFVANHIRDIVLQKIDIPKTKTLVIPNGIDTSVYKYKVRTIGFNICYVGYINYKKGPMLLLHTFKAIYDMDSRYKLYIAGEIQDERYELYFNQMLSEMKLEANVFLEGWQADLNSWLEDKNYILCTSVLESQNISVMQAMSKGIKPVIHNFVGSKNIYPSKYLWNTIAEATDMITNNEYNSQEYKSFVDDYYSTEYQYSQINCLINPPKVDTLADTINLINEKLTQQIYFRGLQEVTLIIPSHNRVDMLISDISKGFKLGNTHKIIVDDCSEDIYKNVLCKFEKNLSSHKILYHLNNLGPAECVHTSMSQVKSKYVSFCDDDDIIFCLNENVLINLLDQIGDEVSFIIPRFVVNMNEDGTLKKCYDRSCFENSSCSDILKYFCTTGEMLALRAGGIFLSTELKSSLPDPVFRTSEDYVMLSRHLANFPDRKIKITDSYVYVRRRSHDNISKNMNDYLLTLHLLSIFVAAYHCFKLNTLDSNDFIARITERGELLESIYGFGTKVVALMKQLFTKQLNLKNFMSLLNKDILSLKSIQIDISALPYEIIEMFLEE